MWATLFDVLTYLGIVLVGILIWGALSPFEVMGWWAGWFGDEIHDGGAKPQPLERPMGHDPSGYLIFMSGVGKATGETLGFREQEFLRRLARAAPGMVIIDDLFPYSVNNMPLTGQPVFARLWRWALERKLQGARLAGYLINIRNIWQLMISADKRYGPMYNQALAQVMLRGLEHYHFDVENPKPLFIMGYSGAGQLAVGPAAYLREWLQTPVYMISLGGVFVSDPSLLEADHLYHLHGSRDSIHHYGLLAPGRWPFSVASDWNRARRQGRVTLIQMGPMCHTGRGGYLDHKSILPDGVAHVDRTVATVTAIVRRHTAPAPAPKLPQKQDAVSFAAHAQEDREPVAAGLAAHSAPVGNGNLPT